MYEEHQLQTGNKMIDLCILCLNSNKPLTDEHIFPYAAGGRISGIILCTTCNEKFGKWIDSPYLEQKHIQLARAVRRIAGRAKKIPQPFSDRYTIGNDNSKEIKIDQDFNPVIVPQAPEIWVTENKEIGIKFSRDIKYANEIPEIIRTSYLRFFKSDEGKSLRWTEEEKQDAIKESIEEARNIRPTSESIQLLLNGTWHIDLKTSFAEHVKVIYEICCIEFGKGFIYTSSGEMMRTFLINRCRDNKGEDYDLEDLAKHLNVISVVPPDLDDLISDLTQNAPNAHHFAIITSNSVIVSMFGMGAAFSSKDLPRSTTNNQIAKVYLNSIDGKQHGVYGLRELLT